LTTLPYFIILSFVGEIVRFIFADRKLERLYTHGEDAAKFPPEVISALLRRVRHIEAAHDERDLRHPPSVHYERLKGHYIGKDSMRLNRQWRLILSVEEDTQGKYVVIHEITNHYGE
jgi:proteic killer suppression protein